MNCITFAQNYFGWASGDESFLCPDNQSNKKKIIYEKYNIYVGGVHDDPVIYRLR
jgi:hypothetical protein